MNFVLLQNGFEGSVNWRKKEEKKLIKKKNSKKILAGKKKKKKFDKQKFIPNLNHFNSNYLFYSHPIQFLIHIFRKFIKFTTF